MSGRKLRRIDPAPYRHQLDLPPVDFGAKPVLQWIAIAKLRVDEAYQRDIRKEGKTNLRKIATHFRWNRFSPVIVSAIEDGLFVVIDGQHHALAAPLRGIPEIPCAIVEAAADEEAEAFVTINTQRLAITPMQMHAARLAAGDPSARELAAVCERAGVSVCRYPIPAKEMKVGETLAAGCLYRQIKRHGAVILEAALRCVTETGDGNIGMLRAPIIEALCFVLSAEPQWVADTRRLIGAFRTFDYAAAFQEAGRRSYSERCGVASILVDFFCAHIESALETAA